MKYRWALLEKLTLNVALSCSNGSTLMGGA
jgi:hypothetical protein